MMSWSAKALITIIIYLIHLASPQPCGTSFSHYGVSFELSPLTLTSNDSINFYNISDNDGFDYYFNLCAATNSFPDTLCNKSSFAFQIDHTQTEPKCYHLSTNNIVQYNLIDTDDPSFGISLTYSSGEYDSNCKGNTQLILEFICDPDYYRNDYKSMLSDAIITTGLNCISTITLSSVYGCPIQCQYGTNNKLCSSHGVCGHDKIDNTAKCFCYAGYSGADCSKYLGTNEAEKDFNYNAGIDFSSPWIHKLYSDKFGYNVTYNLSFLEYGMGNKKYFTLRQLNNDPCYLYFNLINDSALDILQPIGVGAPCNKTTINDFNSKSYSWNHTFGYVYAQCPDGYEYPYTGLPSDECDSFGRVLKSFEFYDIDEPYRGFTFKYINGDSAHAFSAQYESVFNFICVDDYSKEIIDDINGLNTYFNDKKYTFRYINTDNDQWSFMPNTVSVDIYTVAACPVHCVSATDKTLELCHSNGICAFDPDINTVKCLCDGSDATDPIYCDVENITLSTMNPSENLTQSPSVNTSFNPSKYPTVVPFEKTTYSPSSGIYSSLLTNINVESTVNINITRSDTKLETTGKPFGIIILLVVIALILIIFVVVVYVRRNKLKVQLSQFERNMKDNKESMINNNDTVVDDMYKTIATPI